MPRRHPRTLLTAGAITYGLTAAGAAIGSLWPALVSGEPPHPALHGTAGEAASILVGNLRVLAGPFVLAAFSLHRSRSGRRFGDALIATLVFANTMHVGLVLGGFGVRLIPYVPQLPLEWLALTLSLSVWLELRDTLLSRGRLVGYAVAIILVAVAGSVVETFLTPHVSTRPRTAADGSRWADPIDRRPLEWDRGRLPAPGVCAGGGLLAARSRSSLPLANARFRSAEPALFRACQPPTIPPRRVKT